MRGRTNINGGGNVVVNGLVKEYTVAPESNITKGDFVRLETKASTEILLNERSESGNWVDYIGKIANKKHVFLIDSSLYIIGIENKVPEILSYYNQHKVVKAAMSSDGIIYCVLNAEPWVISLRITENDTFALENTAENIPDSYTPDSDNIKYCRVIGNNFYVISHYINKQSNTYYLSVGVTSFDITDSAINFKWIKSNGYSNGATYGRNAFDVIDDTIYFYSVVQRVLMVNSIYIDESNYQFTTHKIGEYGTDNETGGLWPLGNNLLIPMQNTILKINVITGDSVSLPLSTFGMTNAKYHARLLYPFKNKIAVLLYYYITSSYSTKSNFELAVLALDEQSNQLIKWSNVLTFYPRISGTKISFQDGGSTTPLTGIADNDSIILINMYSSGYMTSLLTASEDYSTVMEGVDQNIVKPYDGKQSAIGFAKTGGTAGEKIKVYVPKEIG